MKSQVMKRAHEIRKGALEHWTLEEDECIHWGECMKLAYAGAEMPWEQEIYIVFSDKDAELFDRQTKEQYIRKHTTFELCEDGGLYAVYRGESIYKTTHAFSKAEAMEGLESFLRLEWRGEWVEKNVIKVVA